MKRPTSILVIAILHFVFGSCGGLCNLLGLVGAAASFGKLGAGANPKQAEMQKDIERRMDEKAPGNKAVQAAGNVMGLIYALMLIAAGIGLLSMQPWARVLSIVYGFLATLTTLASLVYQIIFIIPMVREVLPNDPNIPPEFAQAMTSFIYIGVGVGACIGLGYPITVLIIMLLPGTAAAFSRTAGSYKSLTREEDEDTGYERGWGDDKP
jgi:hypothetical protein